MTATDGRRRWMRPTVAAPLLVDRIECTTCARRLDGLHVDIATGTCVLCARGAR